MKNQADIAVVRVFDKAQDGGRARLLVDRVWPRGVSKSDLACDDWIHGAAPSHALRKWFGHDPRRWGGFRERYRAELDVNSDAVTQCLDWCRRGPVTLLYSARDREHNQAVILRDYLMERLGGRGADYV